MDRNDAMQIVVVIMHVALRKESVDRNQRIAKPFREQFKSLSARRAWIEICCACCAGWLLAVALRKESVDRNLIGCINRAIDIVALRKESVDRNSRPLRAAKNQNASLSARRAWIEI